MYTPPYYFAPEENALMASSRSTSLYVLFRGERVEEKLVRIIIMENHSASARDHEFHFEGITRNGERVRGKAFYFANGQTAELTVVEKRMRVPA